MILKSVDSGSYLINGLPYQRGGTVPRFLDHNGEEVTDKVAFFDITGKQITSYTLYSDITNGDTSTAFASFADLVTFCINNVFFQQATSGGGSSSATVLTYNVVGSGAGAGEVNAGASVTIATGKTIFMIWINSDRYYPGQFTYDSGTGALSMVSAGNFEAGSVLQIFCQ